MVAITVGLGVGVGIVLVILSMSSFTDLDKKGQVTLSEHFLESWNKDLFSLKEILLTFIICIVLKFAFDSLFTYVTLYKS